MSNPNQIKYYMVEGDTNREISLLLKLDGVAMDLTGWTVECHQLKAGTAVTITDVTLDADPTTGVLTTTFVSALVAGTYTLEWEATKASDIITWPGNADDRPLQIVRSQAA